MEQTTQQDLGILLTEALREIRELKDQVSDVLILFKPKTPEKRLTKKEKFDIAVRKMRIEETARLIAKN